MGHDGPGHLAIAEGRPVARALKLYHGKAGAGLSIEMKVRLGPVTILGVTQTADGRLKLIAAEGESIAGPTFRIGNTNSRIRFREGSRRRSSTPGARRARPTTSRSASAISCRAIRKVADLLGLELAVVAMNVRFLGPDTDAYVASVERHAAEFEELTGIGLEIQIVPSDLYFSNRIHHLLDGDGAADVYMSGPVLVWEHLAAGFVQPLDEFLERAGDELRRRGLLRAADAQQPLERPLRRRARRGAASRDPGELRVVQPRLRARGARERRRRGAHDVGAILRVGAHDRREDEGPRPRVRAARTPARGTRCTPGSPRSSGRTAAPTSRQAALRSPRPSRCRRPSDFVAALRDAGPIDWPEQRWYELALDFARGRYGLLVDSDHYVAYFEDPAISTLVGEIAYAPPPLGPTGSRRPNLWTWSVVMNTRSEGQTTRPGGSSSGRLGRSSCSARRSRAT